MDWKKLGIEQQEDVWWKNTGLVVVELKRVQQDLLKLYHDGHTGGHPGIEKMIQALTQDYWWPGVKDCIQGYVKGCAMCQQNKTNTHRTSPPLNLIHPNENLIPFSMISVDLITKLPVLNGFDSILTITNQGCTKAVVLIPCRETMGSKDLAHLYFTQAFPYIGILSRLISDRDTCFTSQMFKEICDLLKIKQNISSAYHPQTDGQSE